MLRKCAFVLLSVFLRQFGATPQVVAASIVLFLATSAQLRFRPYADPKHNMVESIGLHACQLQLLVTLMSNMIGRVDRLVPQSPIGPVSTMVVISFVFASTAQFFWVSILWTVRRSQSTAGVVGNIARCCGKKIPWLCTAVEVGGEERTQKTKGSVYARAAFRENRTGGVAEQRRKSQLVAAQQARRLSLNAALGKKALLRKVKSQKARALVSEATSAIVAHRETLVDRRSAATKRLKRRLESQMKRRRVGTKKVNATTSAKTNAKVGVEAQVGVASASAHVGVEAQTTARLGANAGVRVEVAAGAEATARLGANAQWQANVDPTTGSTYYYNTETGESSWVRPVH